eukprot:GHVL01010351.1.p1 GENE.GHVL01010351.1~~GHVL01010351.1.p1  ORF type:complete len:172 (+),score=23.20 GHVL01010351.1:265-780(+)
MRSQDISRAQCPDRIVEDAGSAFGMGCIGGFIFHMIKGARNSPKGDRLAGAMYSAKTRAPVLGGHFAVWGLTFASFDCSLQYIRQTEDHVNPIVAGFCTGGVLALRGGARAAWRSAVVGGVLLCVIEGVSALFSRKMTQTPRQQMLSDIQAQEAQKKAAGNASADPFSLKY